MKREKIKLAVRGQDVDVEFLPLPPDEDAGIIGWGSEDHTLHDPDTEERLTALEAELTAEEWDGIADRVNARFEFTSGGEP